MLQKSDKKCHTYILMFYVLAKLFHKKMIFFLSCVKRQILVLKKGLHKDIFLSFLHSTSKMLIFRETGRAHIECRHVGGKFLFGFF
jgi:hypothetical protein